MVVFFWLAEDTVYNAEPSLSQNHAKNIKIIYFNATDYCHHLVKQKQVIFMWKNLLSLYSSFIEARFSNSVMITCIIAAFAVFSMLLVCVMFLMKTNTQQLPWTSQHLPTNGHTMASGILQLSPTKCPEKKTHGWLGCDLKTGGSCLLRTFHGPARAEGLNLAQAALPPLQMLLPSQTNSCASTTVRE